ncbi:MAG: hypothetical protein LC126_07420 [Bryobacterales bacterium]|nr:hypothetical protein [Bryobacterales bacterium]
MRQTTLPLLSKSCRAVLPLFALTGVILMPRDARAQGPIRPGFNSTRIPASGENCAVDGLDCSTPQVSIGFPVNFFGTTYSSLYVNAHGNVTFNEPRPDRYVPEAIQGSTVPIIAPFFADNDMRDPNSSFTLAIASPVAYGSGTVDGRRAFGASYINQGYYLVHRDKLNSFQVVLIDRSDTGPGNFDIEFNYASITWEASGPEEFSQNGLNGLCGTRPDCRPASAGWSNGLSGTRNRSFQLPGSLVAGAFLDSSPTALRTRSLISTVPGRLVFEVRSGSVTPSMSSLNPSSVSVGSGNTTLQINGANFASGARIRWTSPTGVQTFVATAFRSASLLDAVLPSSLLSTLGTAQIAVVNPDNAVSNSLPFIVGTTRPTITSINPNTVSAGTSGLTLQINGSNFVAAAALRWTPPSGAATSLQTTFRGAALLEVSVPAGLLSTATVVQLAVVNPGNAISNSASFTITAPVPVLTSINPNSTPAGPTALTIQATGANFVSGAVLRWAPPSGSPAMIPTVFRSSTLLEISIAPGLLTTAGVVQVSVVNPDSRNSASLPFTIAPPTPRITALTPPAIMAGSSGTTIQVSGTNFVTGAQARWTPQGGPVTSLPASFRSSTALDLNIPGNLFSAAGNVQLVVVNPNNLASNGVTFTILPRLNLGVSAPSVTAADQPVTITMQTGSQLPSSLRITLSLSFTPSAAGLPQNYRDPALQFASGGTSLVIDVPSGAASITLPNSGALQTGTVAGTITIAVADVRLMPGNTAVSLNPAPATSITIGRIAPAIAGVARFTDATASGFTLELNGYTTTRDLTNATVSFASAPGSTLGGATTFTIPLNSIADPWFGSDSGRANGSRFSLRMPFTVTGRVSAIGSATIALQNSVGTSASVTATH